jgi:hypothetical protein
VKTKLSIIARLGFETNVMEVMGVVEMKPTKERVGGPLERMPVKDIAGGECRGVVSTCAKEESGRNHDVTAHGPYSGRKGNVEFDTRTRL